MLIIIFTELSTVRKTSPKHFSQASKSQQQKRKWPTDLLSCPCTASCCSKLALGPWAHGSQRHTASTTAQLQVGVREEPGPLPASQLLWGNLRAGSSKFNPTAQEAGPRRTWAGGLGRPVGWTAGWGVPSGFSEEVFVFLGKEGGRPACRDVPYAFTINHHRRQQALLLAAEPVMRLALLVPEAGQALGAGQVLADRVLHAGAQAMCASGPGAGGKRRAHVNQLVLGQQQGAQVRPLSCRDTTGPGTGSERPHPHPRPQLLHTASQQPSPHADSLCK